MQTPGSLRVPRRLPRRSGRVELPRREPDGTGRKNACLAERREGPVRADVIGAARVTAVDEHVQRAAVGAHGLVERGGGGGGRGGGGGGGGVGRRRGRAGG